MHSGDRSAHGVGPRRVRVVSGPSIPARHACVGVVDVATVGATVVPILPTLVGRGWACRKLRAGTVAAKPGWLLWKASRAVCTTRATVAPVVATAIVVLLLLWRGVDVGWGLLVDSHAELLDVCELALHSGQGGCLALHCFLCGGVRGAEVRNRFVVQCDGGIVVHGGHTVAMGRGWDRCLVDKRDRGGPILLEGVDRLDDRWGFVFACDPIFVLLGVHPTPLYDAQSDVDDVAIVHRVAGCARVGRANEEARCEGLETVGGMPVGGHSLSILFAIFGRRFAIFLGEPVEHVEEDGVRLLHANWLVRLANCYW